MGCGVSVAYVLSWARILPLNEPNIEVFDALGFYKSFDRTDNHLVVFQQNIQK